MLKRINKTTDRIKDKRINKKAYLEADILSFFIILIFLFLYILAMNFIKLSDFQIKSEQDKLNNDLVLINILNFPTEEGKFYETILIDYSNDNFEKTKSILNKIFFDAFDKKICYKLVVEDKRISETQDCEDLKNLMNNFDAKTKIYYGEKPIEIRLYN